MKKREVAPALPGFEDPSALLQYLWELWTPQRAPILYHEIDTAHHAKEGLRHKRILHNCPFFTTNYFKIQHILSFFEPIELVCTATEFVDSQPGVVDYIKLFPQITFLEDHADCVAYHQQHPIDIILDTGGEFANLIHPTIGVVELTQSGEFKYRQMNTLSYPVVSVDSSIVKRIEDALGSSDGFYRAVQLLHPFPAPPTPIHVMIIGFGKVGLGMYYELHRRHPDQVVFHIVDRLEERVQKARDRGIPHAYLFPNELPHIERQMVEMDYIVTGTGVENLLSNHLSPSTIDTLIQNQTVLLNMGVFDEWGPSFPTSAIAFDKQPVNFCLSEPTQLEFLDPAFTAHHLGADALLQCGPGVHPLDTQVNDHLLAVWKEHHKKEIPSFH